MDAPFLLIRVYPVHRPGKMRPVIERRHRATVSRDRRIIIRGESTANSRRTTKLKVAGEEPEGSNVRNPCGVIEEEGGRRRKRKGARVEEDEVGSQSLKSRLSNRVLIFCEFRVVGKFLESSGLILSEIFLILKDSRKEGRIRRG